MFDLDTLIVLIPALPLAATLVTAALGKWLLKEYSHVPVLAATGLAFVLSLVLLGQVRSAAGPTAHADAAQHERSRCTRRPLLASDAAKPPKSVGYEHVVNLWTWAAIDAAYPGEQVHLPPGVSVAHPLDLKIDIALRADPLTSIMLATVMLAVSARRYVCWAAVVSPQQPVAAESSCSRPAVGTRLGRGRRQGRHSLSGGCRRGG